MTSNASQPWKSRLAEIALIFAVFSLQGAWPVPDVNEPYYLGKAIHFWNPNWVPGDFFLDSSDSHEVFYFTFGWLSLFLSRFALAWTGRVLTWALLAWSWQRLSWSVIPRTGFALLSGALFACFVERFHMAGEWVIGGVEAKGFAFFFLFLAIEALVRNRWNRAWLLLGAASLFHVLVGGWAAVAAAFAWLWLGRQRPPLRTMLPGIIGGLFIALPSLYFSLMLTWGVPKETADRAAEIYVYYRLPHHLVLRLWEPKYYLRFAGLAIVWALLCRWIGERGPELRLRGFIAGALGIALVGGAISLTAELHRVASESFSTLAANVLRFYWFRLADVAVPMGAALLGALCVHRLLAAKVRAGKVALAVAVAIGVANVGSFAWERIRPSIPRADAKVRGLGGYEAWAEACDWIANSSAIPPDARFLTPIDSSSFKWRTHHAEVVTRKEIPQDARSIVEWWAILRNIHGIEREGPQRYWYGSVSELSPERIKELAEKYQFDYLLTEAPGLKLPPTPAREESISAPELPFRILHKNGGYAVYQVRGGENPPPAKGMGTFFGRKPLLVRNAKRAEK